MDASQQYTAGLFALHAQPSNAAADAAAGLGGAEASGGVSRLLHLAYMLSCCDVRL